MCGGSILSSCPRNPHGHERALKEEDLHNIFLSGFVMLNYVKIQTLLQQ